MSLSTADQHVRYHRLITFGKESEPPRYSDIIEDSINANGWTIYRQVDQFGKIIFTAKKGSIEIKLETKEKTALPIKAIKDSIGKPWEGPKFVEVPDEQNKMSASLEKDRFIEKHYRDSSILTPGEYMDSLIPEFNEITKIAELNKIVGNVSK